jgi:hypothetical protein
MERPEVSAPRSSLFKEVIVHLDSAAGEARAEGNEDLAEYIEDTLIRFVTDELIDAGVQEME